MERRTTALLKVRMPIVDITEQARSTHVGLCSCTNVEVHDSVLDAGFEQVGVLRVAIVQLHGVYNLHGASPPTPAL
jgi:hypothetical protein